MTIAALKYKHYFFHLHLMSFPCSDDHLNLYILNCSGFSLTVLQFHVISHGLNTCVYIFFCNVFPPPFEELLSFFLFFLHSLSLSSSIWCVCCLMNRSSVAVRVFVVAHRAAVCSSQSRRHIRPGCCSLG